MKAPRVSLVLATCRLGGLDVTWGMLRDQTFKDVELVLVDFWWEERQEIVRRRWAETGLNGDRLIHVPPRKGRSTPGHQSHQAYNTGYALARGEIICTISDFWYGYPEFVADQIRVHEETGGKVAHCGDNHTVRFPPLGDGHPEFSCFASEFDAARDLPSLSVTKKNAKPRGGPYPSAYRTLERIPWTHYHATQHESFSRATLYTLNGLDEVLDGGRGYGDLDMGLRLTVAGIPIVHDVRSGVTVDMDHHLDLPAAMTWGDLSPSPECSQDNFNILGERQMALQDGELEPRADNGGFDVAAPYTPQDAINDYWAKPR